ncbi:MAG TPA: HlyD family efflux transporter periplasmic adaptor subunit [Myxococcota bacterium]|nr:HlyD family efflux transporter periplasmic adaptor subunit [Myxococcota bacterium]HOH77746.1 HlyD family efflux transporter periplasmic adaptor subunit [Myxococcota bacterium]
MKRLTVFIITGTLLGATACSGKKELLFASGVFEATEIVVSSEATGRLVEFTPVEGLEIAAGDVVGKVDCRQIELQREQLVTRMNGLQTRVTDVYTQTAALNQQIAAAEKEKRRVQELLAGGSATGKQMDDVVAQIEVLKRQRAAAAQSMKIGNRVIDDERAAMEVQLAQLDDQIARCTLKSPVSGTVLVKYAQQGEFTATGKALFKLADMRNMFLRAYVTADQLSQVKLGQTVKVRADFGPEGNRDYDGRIAWVATKSEFTPKTIQTRDERANQVYAVKVAVTNDGFLKLGMYGAIPMGTGDAGNPGAEHK